MKVYIISEHGEPLYISKYKQDLENILSGFVNKKELKIEEKQLL